MELVADLHTHSHYSRATSKDLTLPHLARWAQLKGVAIVATGDISHPGWLQELAAALEPAEDGLYRLKPEIAAAVAQDVPPACRAPVRFVLGGEISNIYKRHDAVRKVHNLIFAPTLELVARIQQALEKIGNIRADGRPILGLDSRDLLETVLDVDPACHLIPAHIWTPWFSMLGSKSGFATVEECFGDLTPHIFALETGLSSDPPMNWRVTNLDRYTLVSNSDAHSPQKLGREATLFRCEPTYAALFDALHSGAPEVFGGTLEFFPEEGKYHLDGHRKCGIVWEPPETLAHHLRCPVCGREVTVGVMHRVEALADRPAGAPPPHPRPYTNLIALPEVLGEVHGVGAGSRKVAQAYDSLLAKLGPELGILRQLPLEEIAAAGGSRVAEAIGRMRRGEVVAEGGYDGEYGVIRIFAAAGGDAPQLGFFAPEPPPARAAATVKHTAAPDADAASVQPSLFAAADAPAPAATSEQEEWLARLNADQAAAVACVDRHLVIVAGPGTGKTRTLTVRLANLVRRHGVAPAAVLALTFTNKAAAEMAERLAGLLGPATAQRMTVTTFHALGAALLREFGEALGLLPTFAIVDDEDRRLLLRRVAPAMSEADLTHLGDWISRAKQQLLPPDAAELAGEAGPSALYAAYQTALGRAALVDFDDLVMLPARLLAEQPAVAATLHARYHWLAVDEYQDVNFAQVEWLRRLAAGGANVCVIGDPDQAIYGFRGADHRFFRQFAADFPGAVTIHLRQSYRSPQSLLDAAGQVIAHNADAEAQRLVSDFTATVKLTVLPVATDRAEAETIVHRIEQMVGGTSMFSRDSGRVGDADAGDAEVRSFADFAVLHRLGSQRVALVEAFDRSGIPYQVVGQAGLAEHREVRGALALLRLPDHPLPALAALLGAGKSSLPTDALERLADEVAAQGVAAALAHAAVGSPAQRRRLAGLAALWADLPAAGPVAGSVGQALAGWLAWQGETATPAQTARAAQLQAIAAAYGEDVTGFLTALALQRDGDGYDPRADRVAILTLHAAKGLEFPVVFMAGCEEGLLPYLPPNKPADIAEERRLFYVGMTRARAQLIVTHAQRRLLYGRTVEAPVSRFVDEIAAALKEVQAQAVRPAKPVKEDPQLPLF